MADKINTATDEKKQPAVSLTEEVAAKVRTTLEAEGVSFAPKKSEQGFFKQASDKLQGLAWKIVTWVDGKESAELAGKALTAYGQGHFKEGFDLAMSANKKAVGYAVETAAANAKKFVTGGESVIQPGQPSVTPPPTAERNNKGQNTR